MSRSNHRRPPAVETGVLPLQESQYKRLFQLGYYAARASECLLERIVSSKGQGEFTFVFNRGGQLIQIPLHKGYLLSEKDVTIIRELAMKVMVQNAQK